MLDAPCRSCVDGILLELKIDNNVHVNSVVSYRRTSTSMNPWSSPKIRRVVFFCYLFSESNSTLSEVNFNVVNK